MMVCYLITKVSNVLGPMLLSEAAYTYNVILVRKRKVSDHGKVLNNGGSGYGRLLENRKSGEKKLEHQTKRT